MRDGKEGLSAAANATETGDRDSSGRFLPGHSVGKLGGRPSKAQELAMLDAIRTSLPPEKVQEHINKALQLAVSQNSARGIIAVLEFAAGYSLGKPTQRIINEQGGLSDVLAELQDSDE